MHFQLVMAIGAERWFWLAWQIAYLEAALASAQKTIDERSAPAPAAEDVQDESEVAALRDALTSTQAELNELKATIARSDDLESSRGQLATKETELAALRDQLESDVETSRNELATVREILDHERKSRNEDEDTLRSTLYVDSTLAGTGGSNLTAWLDFSQLIPAATARRPAARA
jgi:chromosome segregation ATPase